MARNDAYTCPECGQRVLQAYRRMHICRNEATFERIRKVLTDDNDPRYAVSRREYIDRAHQVGAPSAKIVRDFFGGHNAAAKHFGLQVRELGKAHLYAALEREDWRTASPRARVILPVMEGLPVCGEPRMTARQWETPDGRRILHIETIWRVR